jgi:hypothetical protein
MVTATGGAAVGLPASEYLLALGVFKQLLKMFSLSAESVRADFQIPVRGGFLFLGIFLRIGFLARCEAQTKPVESL